MSSCEMEAVSLFKKEKEKVKALQVELEQAKKEIEKWKGAYLLVRKELIQDKIKTMVETKNEYMGGVANCKRKKVKRPFRNLER